jgi:hypothetical protein
MAISQKYGGAGGVQPAQSSSSAGAAAAGGAAGPVQRPFEATSDAAMHRKSCYHCYAVFYADRGCYDSDFDRHFCSMNCAMAHADTTPLQCASWRAANAQATTQAQAAADPTKRVAPPTLSLQYKCLRRVLRRDSVLRDGQRLCRNCADKVPNDPPALPVAPAAGPAAASAAAALALPTGSADGRPQPPARRRSVVALAPDALKDETGAAAPASAAADLLADDSAGNPLLAGLDAPAASLLPPTHPPAASAVAPVARAPPQPLIVPFSAAAASPANGPVPSEMKLAAAAQQVRSHVSTVRSVRRSKTLAR